MTTRKAFAAFALLGAWIMGCPAQTVYVSTSGAGGGGGGAGGGSACPGQCVPLGSYDWQGPALLWTGNKEAMLDCPPEAPVPSALVFTGLDAPIVCDICKCDAPSGSCALPTTLTAYDSTVCPVAPVGSVPTPFDAPAGWDGSCTAVNPIPANQ